MLAAKVAFPAAVVLLASLASEASHSRRSSDDDRLSSRARKSPEKHDWHFEQCRFVNVWKEHLGYVSVLVFLDPAWQYSFRQAVMLELLSLRLQKSGFSDIRFFAISPLSNSMENERSEDDLEIEAWREIGARYEMESFVDDNFLRGSNGSKITFLRDNPQSRLWERFRASRQQAIIIDRCGKLTYHVIMPWSILFFPYVKAAILSTYKEDPCGGCDPAVYRETNRKDHVVEFTKSIEEVASSTRHEIDIKLEVTSTTENPENVTLHHDESSSEEERETFSIPFKETINDLDRPSLSTESLTQSTTYQRDDDTTGSQFDEDRLDAEGTRGQEGTTKSEDGDTVVTFEPHLFSPEEKELNPQANSSSLNHVNHGDTTDRTSLLLDESTTGLTESDSTSVDEIRDNTTPGNANRFEEKDTVLPLRIIMYAPHVHKNDRKTKKHTHLILKTDDPDFHGHFDSGVDIASSPGADSHVANSEEFNSGTMEADTDEENADQTYMFDRNESPGLYGEVADYWKSYEDNDITDRNETFNDTDNNSTESSYDEEHRSNIVNHATSLSKPDESYSVANVTEDPNVESSTDSQNILGSNTIKSSRPTNANDDINKEEEMKYNVIEHYSKLLSWINFRLNK